MSMFNCCAAAEESAIEGEGSKVEVLSPAAEEEPEEPEENEVQEEPEVVEPRKPFKCSVHAAHNAAWGLKLEPWNDFMQVLTVKEEGRIATYNHGQEVENLKIKPGDLITNVMLQHQPKDMQKVLQDLTLTEVPMHVAPLLPISITVQRAEGAPWGLNVVKCENNKGIVVNRPIKDDSPFSKQEEKLEMRDVITKINYVERDATSLMDVLKDKNVSEIRISAFRPMPRVA